MNFNLAIFMMFYVRGQVLGVAPTTTANAPPILSTFDQRISEMITKLDLILSACTQQFYRFSHSESDSQVNSEGNIATMISEIRSDVKALRNDLLELKPKVPEDTSEQLSLDKLSESKAAKGENECSLGTTELIGSGRTLLEYLQRIDFNIFLGKHANASSTYPNTEIKSAVDGNFVTLFHTNIETSPWFYVDLQFPHLIWEITITLREITRAGGIRIYVAKNILFDTYGKPDTRNLPLFASQVGNSLTLDLKFTFAGGMCGRYVVVKREVAQEYLIFYEIQGVGFKF